MTSYAVGGALGPILGGIVSAALLVGIGLSHRRSGHGAASDRGPDAPPGIQGPRGPAARHLERRSFPRGGAAGDLRAQAVRGRWPQRLSGLTAVAGVLVGMVFIRRQRRLDDPFMDLRLFRSAAFSASLAAYTLATFISFGSYIFIAQYLQLVLGLSPLDAGLWTVPLMCAYIVGSLLVPALSREFDSARADERRPDPVGLGIPPFGSAGPQSSLAVAPGGLDRVLAGPVSGGDSGYRSDRGQCPDRAGRSGVRVIGDQLGARAARWASRCWAASGAWSIDG